ncbi:MAG: hypothetical protein KAH23_09740 [Kiritimatiellae bacterium]|nr:hypothetical protein [Kiritimatiellia bacterium]
MTLEKRLGREDLVIALALGIIIAMVCIISGPKTIDSMDGPELAVAGLRMEIPHAPGYPLMMWLLRLSGGRDYNSFRVFGCMVSGLAACGVFFAIRSFRIPPTESALGALMLISSGAVMTQLNILEVHSLSLLLASLAIALRETRLGSYALSMSVFGGHPLSIFLIPIVINRRWIKTWPLALIPATMWLYVPIRSHTALVMHYGRPEGIAEIIQYMTMYGGRFSGFSLSGLWRTLGLMGPVSVVCFLIAVWFGRFDRRFFITIIGILLVFLFYGIPDVEAYSWLLLLPLSVAAASGLHRLFNKQLLVRLMMLCLIAASIVSGTLNSWDKRGDVSQIISSDILRGIPPNRILCTTDGLSYYCAYLMEVEDRRPDLLAVDRFGLIYKFSLLNGPLRTVPSKIAGRYVYATGAWGSLPPSGLLFSTEGTRLAWEEYDVFSIGIRPTEQMACDVLAEFWALRAVQEDNHSEIMAAFGKAQEYAESEGAINAINNLIESY